MPESIFVQVGQCGNQIGYHFWELAVKEYLMHQTLVNDPNCFFKLYDTTKKSFPNNSDSFKARAILVDMEESVVSRIMRGPFRNLFDKRKLVTDVSGSGNNWAVGNKLYGSKYKNELIDLFRKEAEECNNLQCFFVIHSLGGGTGSGLGTAIVEYLYDEFPKIPKFVFAAFPSYQDDVITSPYNAMLANSRLIKFADCVFPFDNKTLTEMCFKFSKILNPQSHLNSAKSRPFSVITNNRTKDVRPFDDMNDIISNAILNLTCYSRFPGHLNIDINEIVMNMAPYPRLHYLIPSVSPVFYVEDLRQKPDEMFSEAFSLSHQLFQCPVREGVLLGRAILCRGQISMSDILSNVERLKNVQKFVPWNEDGLKIGLCDVPHINSHHSLLMLSNTSSISKPLNLLKENFMKMYRKKAHLHHFLDVESMETDNFKSSLTDLKDLIEEYKSMEKVCQKKELQRLKVLL